MFSSNQKLEISGSIILQEISDALKLAFNRANYTMANICYQKIGNKIFVGWNYEEGWESFPIKSIPSYLIANEIAEFIKKNEPSFVPDCDVENREKGFLMKVAQYNQEIKNSHYTLVSFEPYYNIYNI